MHVYFSGVGGVGIGPLALLALEAGYTVHGSDVVETPMTKALLEKGLELQIVTDDDFISEAHTKHPVDWFVHTAAWKEDHPEIVFAKKHGIKVTKRAEFLNLLLQEKDLKLVAVAGTHGKTTTTGMLVWLFKQLGQPVSYSIGTTISFGPSATYQQRSKYFVYECDEFDRNFLEFKPHLSLITSVDYDHPDTYPTQAEYNGAFNDFITQSEQTIIWQADADRVRVTDATNIDILTESDPAIAQITLPGEHMRRNAWLVHEAAELLFPETETDTVVMALNTFPGTNRRFEQISQNLYTDYAHHPTEIAATIQMAKEVSPNVVVVYQPHQNIRQHEIAHDGGYQDSFVGAKKVYWLPTYLSREDPSLNVLSNTDLIATTTNKDSVVPAEMNQDLVTQIKQHINDGDMVIGMSAGDLDAWLRSI